MPPHFDGVWEMRFFYQTEPTGFPAMEHRMTFDMNVTSDPAPGEFWDNIIVTLKDATTTDLASWQGEFLAAIAPLHSTATVFSRFELWKIPEATYDATFISGASLTSENGTIATTALVAHQDTIVFRSIGGSILRMQIMEGALLGLQGRQLYPTSETEMTTFMDYVVGGTSPFLARDNSRPFFPLAWNGGQNEKLWKKRYRS